MKFFCGSGFRRLIFLCCGLLWVNGYQATWAEEAAGKKEAAQQAQGEKKSAEQKVEAAADKKVVVVPKAPIDEMPKIPPKQIVKPPELIVLPKEIRKGQNEQAERKVVAQPARRSSPRVRPQPKVYYVQPGTQISPALRWHLNRSGSIISETQVPTPLRTAAAAPTTQSPQTFYPGISRLPEQKPFANIPAQPSGFERYWPLLLEAREDPVNGVIIWRLP